MAICCEGLGDTSEAIDWIMRAEDDRDGLCWVLNQWSVFDPLRPDPRCQALLRRMTCWIVYDVIFYDPLELGYFDPCIHYILCNE